MKYGDNAWHTLKIDGEEADDGFGAVTEPVGECPLGGSAIYKVLVQVPHLIS